MKTLQCNSFDVPVRQFYPDAQKNGQTYSSARVLVID